MKGDWLLVLALRERASKESVVEEEVAEQGDLAVWLQQRFNGYFTVLVKNHQIPSQCTGAHVPAGKEEKENILLQSNFWNELLIAIGKKRFTD